MPHPEPLVLRFTQTLNAEDSRGAVHRGESSTAAILRMSREGQASESADEADAAIWLGQAAAAPGRPIILDLTGNTFANSARIAVMLKLWRAVGPERRMSIVAPDALMANVLKRCHIDRLITIHASLAEARSALDG